VKNCNEQFTAETSEGASNLGAAFQQFFHGFAWDAIVLDRLRSGLQNSPFFEVARVLVCCDHFARLIVNANHSGM
jgi:hypothetical protein